MRLFILATKHGDVQWVRCFGTNVRVELRNITCGPKIGCLVVEVQRGPAQDWIVAITEQLRLATSRADTDSDNVCFFRCRGNKARPFLIVERCLAMNEQFGRRPTMRLNIGLQNQLDEIAR